MKYPGSFTVITDEVSQELAEIRAFVREHGLPGIELRSFGGRAFRDLTPADVALLRSAAGDEGWRVYSCATPVFKCDLADSAAIAEHREIFRRSLDTARALNCDLLRVFTFLRQSAPTPPPLLSRARDHVHGLMELAAGSGVRLGIENEHSCLVATADELLALLAPLPADRVGAVWDPCNILYLADTPPPTPSCTARLASRMFHVHVKDAGRKTGRNVSTGPRALPVGTGEVGWPAHLHVLAGAGYGGMLSLETHWRQAALDEKLLHLPAGYAFSAGGAEASRICFDLLRALLNRTG